MCKGSILLGIDQTTIVYPPAPEDRCSGPCIYCSIAEHVAAELCPVCQQPLGFGGILPLSRDLVYTAYLPDHAQLHVYSRPHNIIHQHYACWEQQQAERLATQENAGLKTVQEPINPPSATEAFYAIILDKPDDRLAHLYRYSGLLPSGVNRDDPRLLEWLQCPPSPAELETKVKGEYPGFSWWHWAGMNHLVADDTTTPLCHVLWEEAAPGDNPERPYCSVCKDKAGTPAEAKPKRKARKVKDIA